MKERFYSTNVKGSLSNEELDRKCYFYGRTVQSALSYQIQILSSMWQSGPALGMFGRMAADFVSLKLLNSRTT